MVARYSQPSRVWMCVMSPHHRVLTSAGLVVKSWRIRSGRGVAAGSGMVVVRHRFGVRPRRPAVRISRGDPSAGVSSALSVEFSVYPWGAVGAGGGVVHLGDPLGRFGVDPLAGRRCGAGRRRTGRPSPARRHA